MNPDGRAANARMDWLRQISSWKMIARRPWSPANELRFQYRRRAMVRNEAFRPKQDVMRRHRRFGTDRKRQFVCRFFELLVRLETLPR